MSAGCRHTVIADTELGMEYAKKCNADLLLATDPDCDRVGIAVKNKAGEYELLTGNQTGMLLLDYICSQRIKHGKMPADPVMIKTIVTMDMSSMAAPVLPGCRASCRHSAVALRSLAARRLSGCWIMYRDWMDCLSLMC